MISFIIPSYNQGRFIGQCLDSIAAQGLDLGAFEVIVIDGGSTDDSAELIAAHPVVSEWVSEPDQGHWDAVNKGIRRSRGELVTWINSDDFYFPDVFNRLIDHIDVYPDFDVYYGDADEVDEAGQFLKAYAVEDWNYERLIDRCILSQPASLIRRSVFDRFGYLSGECRVALDLEFWLRIGKYAKFKRVPLKLACTRIWGGTKSSNQQLAMQEDALYYGYKYGGRWSERRTKSAAEARILWRFPSLDRPHFGALFIVFYLLRLVFIVALMVECRSGRFKLNPSNRSPLP